jgi:predicted N-acetyltransferase YhbS
MVTIRHERTGDAVAREQLLDVSYGPVRFTKTSERLREGRLPEVALVATEGRRVVGSVRLWPVSAGRGQPALLLGPLAVDPGCRKRGIGSALVQRALREAKRHGHGAVLLVGDAPYYARFGFQAAKAAELQLPGRFERERLLGLELTDGALDGAWGMIAPTGKAATARGVRLGRRKRLVTQAA